MNWWLQLQQVTPRRCIWNTNLDLPARQIPGRSESIVILSGQSLIEKFMARLPQRSLNCQSWQHRAEACTELQLSQLSSKVDKVLFARLSKNYGSTTIVQVNTHWVRSMVPKSRFKPIWMHVSPAHPLCLHVFTLPCESFLCPKCTISRHVQCAEYISCQLKV